MPTTPVSTNDEPRPGSDDSDPVFVGSLAGTETSHSTDQRRCFGLRVENSILQVAIATPDASGVYQLKFDQVNCEAQEGWLTPTGFALLADALETLVERHQMRRQAIAVSLDGDFCVTRVSMGRSDEVDHDLSMLANRVPRYLQLGPGEKVTGIARMRVDAVTEYAVTGVVNRTLIQMIYDACRSVDIEVAWVEPSLVGVARLIGQVPAWANQPVMIADGMGQQWDVGIACSGRLLLDYRPATATSVDGLRDALDGHISRLKRFCHRHLRMITGELTELLVCAEGEKPQQAIEVLQDTISLEPKILGVPLIPHLYKIAASDRGSYNVPAVAAVLPLLLRISEADVPDMLVQVRRAPDLTVTQRMIRKLWPVMVAALILCVCYAMVARERARHASTDRNRQAVEAEIVASRIKFGQLARQRELLDHFETIQTQLEEPSWEIMIGNLARCLPDSARINELRIDIDGGLVIEGTVQDESIVYEVVNSMRRLPRITQVALKGTAPEQDSDSTRFMIRLAIRQTPMVTPTENFDE